MEEILHRKLPDGTSYQVMGKGKPVMLVHGFGETGHVWKNQWELASEYLLIIPDLPGSGASEAALSLLPGRSMDAMAACMMAIVQKENIDNFTMIGHSMGGYITLAFAEKYPEKLDGFGLVHSTAYADSAEKKATREKSISFIRSHGAKAFLEQMIPNLYGEKFREEHPDMVALHLEQALSIQPSSLISYYEMMMARPDRTSVLADFQKPILFVIGLEDKAVNLEDSLAQCHLPAESHVHILETSGHMGMHEELIKTNKALKDFLVHLNEN